MVDEDNRAADIDVYARAANHVCTRGGGSSLTRKHAHTVAAPVFGVAVVMAVVRTEPEGLVLNVRATVRHFDPCMVGYVGRWCCCLIESRHTHVRLGEVSWRVVGGARAAIGIEAFDAAYG
jgi:hypothetical protein